jgi:hypothetical protein
MESGLAEKITVRMSSLEVGYLDRVIEHLKRRNPDWQPTRSDAMRQLIGAAVNTPALLQNL